MVEVVQVFPVRQLMHFVDLLVREEARVHAYDVAEHGRVAAVRRRFNDLGNRPWRCSSRNFAASGSRANSSWRVRSKSCRCSAEYCDAAAVKRSRCAARRAVIFVFSLFFIFTDQCPYGGVSCLPARIARCLAVQKEALACDSPPGTTCKKIAV